MNDYEPTGMIEGHGFVDLGLSVKWATCNVGASTPSDYGDYFAWGETKPKSEYTSGNSITYGRHRVRIAGDSHYDAATANWSDSWRLPTKNEIDELIDRCTWEWATQGGHNGYKVTGPNGNCIFLPAASRRHGTSLSYAGKRGRYWSATPYGGNKYRAYDLYFDSDDFRRYWRIRYWGTPFARFQNKI